MPKRQGIRRRTVLWLLIVLATAAGLLLLYLGVARYLLSSRKILEAINKGPDRTFLDYASARCVWPGRIDLKGFRLRDRDLSAEWIFELEEARVTHSVLGLLRKQFHVTSVRGRGLTFRARNRLTPAQATPERLKQIPPIFGFPDPPLLKPGETPVPRTGKEWTIRVEGLVVEPLREIWVDSARFQGEARVSGGFFLRPKLHAEVFPSTLEIRSGALRLRGEPIAERVSGALGGVVHPWHPRSFPGSAMLQFLDGEALLRTRSGKTTALDGLFGGFGQVRLERGHLDLDLRARVERGVAAGTVKISSPDFGVRLVDLRLAGHISGTIRIAKYDLRRGTASLGSSDLEIRGVALEGWEKKGEPWWGRVVLASTGEASVGRAPLTQGTVTAKARDARPLLAVLKVNLPKWAEKLLDLEGVDATARVKLGQSLLEVNALDARVGDYHIQGDYSARGQRKRGAFLVDLGALSVGIGIQDEEREVQIIAPRKWFREKTAREPIDAD